MVMLLFCIRRLSMLLCVVSVLCFVPPAFSTEGDVGVGVDSLWDVKALISYRF